MLENLFKNSVFKASVNTKIWCKSAATRAIKTMAQTAITLIGTDVVGVLSLDWGLILGVCATNGLLSILTSLTGLPEVESEE
jgi:hypothetical protein